MQDYFFGFVQSLEQADVTTCMARLQDAALAHPGDARPLLLLGATLAHEGEPDAAEAAYATALQRDPDLAIARFQLGLLQMTRQSAEAARATWAGLDLLAPDAPLRLFKSALEFLAIDDFSQAYRLLVRGIAANAGNAPLNAAMQVLADQLLPMIGNDRALEGTKERDDSVTAARDLAAVTPRHAAEVGTPDGSAHFLFAAYRKLQ